MKKQEKAKGKRKHRMVWGPTYNTHRVCRNCGMKVEVLMHGGPKGGTQLRYQTKELGAWTTERPECAE